LEGAVPESHPFAAAKPAGFSEVARPVMKTSKCAGGKTKAARERRHRTV